MLHFVVSDTGVGIAMEKQKAIFSAVYAGGRSTTRKYGGTGLGLSISSRLVEMMGGKIWVESTPGKGSQFHFTSTLVSRKRRRMRRPRLPGHRSRASRCWWWTTMTRIGASSMQPRPVGA